jgi:hypothetical protein
LSVAALAQNPITADSPYQVSYAANLAVGESFINIINSGASGQNICASAYAFLPDGQMFSCCACEVPPDNLVTLGVNKDLQNNYAQTSVVIKLIATVGGNCATSAGMLQLPAPGMVAYNTTLQLVGNTNTYNAVNQPFVPSTLNISEFRNLTSVCATDFAGGGFCSSCKPRP